MAEGGRVVNSEARHMGDGGISNTVEVQGFSKSTSQEVLEMYFENSRRSGGGDMEEVQIVDNVAYITFKEAEVAQRVISHNHHQVDGQTLTITLLHPSSPESCYANRVLLQGLNSAVTEELLRNFMETATEAKVREFLYGEEEGNVVVTLSDNIDIVELRNTFQERRLEGAVIKVARVAISNCIIVQNLPSSTSRDAILFYFENKRRSGGGDVERVEMKAEEGYCLVYFDDHGVIDRVLSKSHSVVGANVEVHLHHECLGRRSSKNKSNPYRRISSPGNKDDATLEEENTDNQAKDKASSSVSSNPDKESDFVEVQEWQENDGKNCTLPLWIKYKRAPEMMIIKDMKKIPCSWNFHVYWNFYTKTKQGQQMLHEIVKRYNCSVAVCTDDEDLFIFEVTEKSFEQESDVVCYIHVVLENIYKCAQQCLYFDNLLVDQRMQGDVLQLVRQRNELDGARIELMGQQDLDAMCIICTEKDKMSVLHVVTEIIHNVRECFENQEEVISVDHMWQKVMKHFGYIQKLGDKYPKVTIILDKTKPGIMLKGARDQSKAAADYLMELVGTAHSEIKEDIFSLGYQFEIFTYPEMCDYIDNIIMELSIVWIPNHLTKKIHLFSKKLEKIKGIDKLIKGCVQERLYPLSRDQSVCSFEMFSSLEELKKMHTGKIVISPSHTGLLVTTADEIFESVDAAVQEIISKHTAMKVSRVDEEREAGRIRTAAVETGLLPNTSNENKDPADSKGIENSEVEIVQELMEEIQNGNSEEISEKYNITGYYSTHSIKGCLKDLQQRERYLTSLNENYTEKDSLSASDDVKKEDFPIIIKRKAVDKISPMKYQMFKYFFSDLHVSILQDIEVYFTGGEGCIYVQEESQEVVDKITADIRNAFTEIAKFQELHVSISRENLELAKQLIVEMNSSYRERKVYCYFYDPFTLCIVARTWEEVQAAKHKISFELGYIRIKDHQKKSISAFDDSKNNNQSSSVSSESSPPDNTGRLFTTAEGIKVFVYKCSILRAPVDVIVNAANEDLKHTGGVAKIIADAAGREFTEESKRYIRENGNLTVGATCITSGGNLNYPFVIHTVGPEWDTLSKTSEVVNKCMEDLLKAVIGCFFRAETLQVQSIALPAVSSGIYGFPMEICASQYLNAVLRYSKVTQGTSSLKEIHFIDVNEKILDLIELVFSATLENNQVAAKEFDDKLQRVLSTFWYPSTLQTLKSVASFKKMGHFSENFESHSVLEKHKRKFHFTKAFKVLIYTSDITDSKCKAIVSSEDKDLKSQGGVAKAIRLKAGQKFDDNLANYRGRLLKIGDVIEIDAAGKLKCQKVICCIIPKWTSSMTDKDYKRQLGQCFRSILEKTKAYKSVAMPLFGIGFKDESIEMCGRVLLDCLLQFSKTHREKEVIREIHIVSLDDGAVACVKSIFMEHFDAEKKWLDVERRNPLYLGVGSATASGGHDQPSQDSHVQSSGKRQVSKSGEHNKTSEEVVMDIKDNLSSYKPECNQPPEAQKMNRSDVDKQDQCVICLDTFKNPVKMKKCGHVFCKGCIDTHLKYKPVCPACSTIYGVITGDQPDGKMNEVVYKYRDLNGYDGSGMIEITYNIPDGIQSENHPKPGQHYSGLIRKAYLPNTYKGQKVLHLLHLAFNRQLIFTIGRSVTSGKDMVTWNDIHHKTNKYGGQQKYGYPDPKYLDRVLDELAAKGVTEESEHQDPGNLNAYYKLT